jgi:hypothetical protein
VKEIWIIPEWGVWLFVSKAGSEMERRKHERQCPPYATLLPREKESNPEQCPSMFGAAGTPETHVVTLRGGVARKVQGLKICRRSRASFANNQAMGRLADAGLINWTVKILTCLLCSWVETRGRFANHSNIKRRCYDFDTDSNRDVPFISAGINSRV